ncbi:hypothetical protein ACWJJH_01670 [Endozoicomonadaceae bacterium StTr2]
MPQDKSLAADPQDASVSAAKQTDNLVFLSERDRLITELRQQYLQGKLKADSRRVARKLAELEAQLDQVHS